MQGVQSLILFTAGCIHLAHSLENVRNDGDTCFSTIPWRELWKGIDKLIFSDHSAIVQVLHEIAQLFNRSDTPFPNVREFRLDVFQAHADLKNCVESSTDPSLDNNTVTECFQHLHTFLNNHPNKPCAWAEASRYSMVTLQRLESHYEERRLKLSAD